MADDNAHSGFVADGYERAREALEPQIRKEVENEYADLCNSSGLLRRWFLQREINMEINRRIAMAAPPDALY